MAKNKSFGWDMSVTIDFSNIGGHATFKRPDGKELEMMLSKESIAYIGCILDRAIDHSCILIGDVDNFFNVKTNDSHD